jgi:hypothetical protein
MKNLQRPDDVLSSRVQRRSFLKYAGAGAAGVALLAAGCKKSEMTNEKIGVYVGNGDIGILNYAYALEQLEAAFYTQVIATPYSGMSDVERTFLTDIRDHEIAHREFFKAALATSAIPALEVDFSSIDFTSRDSVLGTAMAFEDLGVTAYDGVGYLLRSADYLLLAGKIVSVEARHAALIRELVAANTFLGDQVDMSSVNISRTPVEVLKIAGKYLKTELNIDGLHLN